MMLQIKMVGEVLNYYHEILKESSMAKEYLRSRGLTKDTVVKFKIGYAPHEPKYAPRFHDRIIFPIWDQQGYSVGWTGRTLINAPAKYLNTRESSIFKKSRLLYAYNLAKESIFKTKAAILTEGQMDVITLHQYGITNVVASSGTSSFRATTAALLARYAQRVYIIFDGDDAGIKASRAARVHLEEAGVSNIVTVHLPEGEDPASYILKYGKSKFLGVLNESRQTATITNVGSLS